MPRPGGRGIPINVRNRRGTIGYANPRRGFSGTAPVSGKDAFGGKIIEGANALEATLSGMRDSVRRRIMRSSVNRALTIIAREIRKSVPKATTPGHDMKRVKKSIGKRDYRSKRDEYAGKTGLRVGNRILDKELGITSSSVAPHAHWVPLGTNERRTKKGARRGKVTPRPFVRSAASRAEPMALEEMRQRFKKQFDKEVEKERRKNRRKG